MQRTLSGVTIETVVGDITRQNDMDAVVNAANAELMPGGGVAGAIHRAAGPGLAEECRAYAPIAPGQAVISAGHDLPNPHVVHCLGPVYGVDEPSDRLLADCYRNALDVADARGLSGVAFPAISTGAFGYPMEGAAGVALQTVVEHVPSLGSVKHIRFVLTDERVQRVHDDILGRLVPA
jgi:O-acetyl-ADP-ribose deacetylase (regulator of RNase III)